MRIINNIPIQFTKNLYILATSCACEAKSYLSGDRGGFLLNLSSLHMRPSLSLLPLSLPSFSSSIYRFLSPCPLSPSHCTRSSFAPWSRSVSAFIDRSQNDLAHVSYSSWRSGVGGLDFSSLSPTLPRDFLFFSSRSDATRRDAARLGADSIPPLPRRPAPFAGRRLARLIDELSATRINRCAIVATRLRSGSHINPGY